MARPRRGVRAGGQAPVHPEDVEVEKGEETLPPPPVGGEANVEGAGLRGSAGPQVAQGPVVGDMTPLIQAIARALQTVMAGMQVNTQPQSEGNGLPLGRLCNLDGVESRGLPTRASGPSSGKRPANWDRDSAKRHKNRRYHPGPRRRGSNPGRGRQGQENFGRDSVCIGCGRHHTGDCWGNRITCWNCEERGHMRRDCPHLARDGQALARAAEPRGGRRCDRGNFQMGRDGPRNDAHVVAVQPEGGGPARVCAQREGRGDNDVIAGNFSLQSLSLLPLINSGSTYSYILREHARMSKIPYEMPDVGVNVTSPFGDTVVVRKLQLIGHISNHAYMCSHLRITTQKLTMDEGLSKVALITAPVLVWPVSGKKVVMYSDASYVGLGWVLMQEGRVVAYASGQLKTHEKNYPTHDIELAKGVKSQTTPMVRVLKDYDLSIEYHPSKAKVVADALSRKVAVELRAMFVRLSISRDGGLVVELQVKPALIQSIREKQSQDEYYRVGLKKEVAEFKWETITMDFVTRLPLTTLKKNSVWVIVDRFTKCAHFLPVHTIYTYDKLAELYIREIVRLHGVPKSIVSDRDPKFTSRFWRCWHTALGSRLNFSTSYHPQTDGQSERGIQVLEDMLRRCRTPVCWVEAGLKLLPMPDILKGTTEKVKLISERLKAASDRQKSYADLKRREVEYAVGDKVFLKVSPWKKVMRFGRKGKWSPRYIRPYEIVWRVGPVAYRLLLPPELEKIHDVFHVSMFRKFRSDPSHIMPVEEIELNPDLSYDEEPIEILASDSKVLRGRTIELVKVKWRHRGVEEATWERYDDMKEQYPYLFPPGETDLGGPNKELEAPGR
ncbi:hypothetical protein V6N11_017995 [Hibiscus sabdariffa]|uniref:Uncharacterized protein n=1 Tax=Hibiscus sabdariffa TaxID=183260 RepID=A0ABR2T623_9ROSI